ncbi:MAG TPA: helix-turn-helix transcriptional regulator [Longilinea sp.]|nr:helix-turn-helix transcriptional regulator [Longilinea sp.]
MEKNDIFSQREMGVIAHLLKGESNKQIASALGVSISTVEFHLGNIYAKLGVNSRAEAILKLSEAGPGNSIGTERSNPGEPRVEKTGKGSENGMQLISPQRTPMKRTIYLLGTCLLGVALAVWLFFAVLYPAAKRMAISRQSVQSSSSTETPMAAAMTTTPGVLVAQTPTVYTVVVDTSTVSLALNWFYIDSSRVYLDATISGFPLPDGTDPDYIVDPQKIALHTADGSPIIFGQSGDMRGGSDGDDSIPTEPPQSFDVVLDAPLADPKPAISQDEIYSVDIPVGGVVSGMVDDDYGTLNLPETSFHLEIKPTYIGSLTLDVQKTATIDDKTVTLRGLEVNPTLTHVVLCVLDPDKAQWVPTMRLLYNGNIYDIYNGWGLTGSNEDPSKGELCYRTSYAFPFDMADDPQQAIAIWVEKLTKDEPEILPPELIAHAMNQLAPQGIEFDYVVASHAGGSIVITKKPESMTDLEAQVLVQKALTEEAAATGVLILDFK